MPASWALPWDPLVAEPGRRSFPCFSSRHSAVRRAVGVPWSCLSQSRGSRAPRVNAKAENPPCLADLRCGRPAACAGRPSRLHARSRRGEFKAPWSQPVERRCAARGTRSCVWRDPDASGRRDWKPDPIRLARIGRARGFAFRPLEARYCGRHHRRSGRPSPILFGSGGLRQVREGRRRAEQSNSRTRLSSVLPSARSGPVAKKQAGAVRRIHAFGTSSNGRTGSSRASCTESPAEPEILTSVRWNQGRRPASAGRASSRGSSRRLADHGVADHRSTFRRQPISAPAANRPSTTQQAFCARSSSGRPVVLASAAGPSLVIDSYGRVMNRLGPTGTRGWLVARVHREGSTTPYSSWELAWLWLAMGIAGIVVFRDLHARGKSRRVGK